MALPQAQGLYEPSFEREACGLGFVADLKHGASFAVVQSGLEILRRLAHRGAAGCDPCSGDGSGILLQIPHLFFAKQLAGAAQALPEAGDYGVAMVFLPRDPEVRRVHEQVLEDAAKHFGQTIIGWRDVPVDSSTTGPLARQSQPVIRQLFIGRRCPTHAFERVLFMIRKRAGKHVNRQNSAFYVSSCSSRTVVYKGLTLPERLADFYLDLRDPDLTSTLALVHSRFSTNTFPTWERCHPYRRIAHNGEINTLRGNQNWMRAREADLAKATFGKHIEDFKPIIRVGGSDSASLDNVVDFLLAGGRGLPHVMMMLMPDAWSSQTDLPEEVRAFYEYHAALVEPWDGPAAVMFSDGEQIGVCLDRNGLRPAKYVVTGSGLVVAASEYGVIDLDAADIIEQGSLRPGQMFLVDTVERKIFHDTDIKRHIAAQKPYGEWLARNKIDLSVLPDVPAVFSVPRDERLKLQRAFGYTREDARVILSAMAKDGAEPVGSMGVDAPLAVLSRRPQSLFRYFKQQFAQVTNPAIDSIREELVMSLVSCVGSEGNLLDETPEQCRLVELEHPVLTNEDLCKLLSNPFDDFETITLKTLFERAGDPSHNLKVALQKLCQQAEQAVDVGYNIIVLSDRGVDGDHVGIPSLLAVAAVHHHLIRQGKRVRAGLVVETAEAREVADVALLIGYGAGAVNPYLAFETIHELVQEWRVVQGMDLATADKHYVKALCKGLLKIMSKMGISTLSSYHGAQIFEAIGIHPDVIENYFTGTLSRVGGIGLAEIAHEAVVRHAEGFAVDHADDELDVGGTYAWRRLGERHLWTPTSIAALQKAVRLEDHNAYSEYTRCINEQGDDPVTLRGLWDFKFAETPIPLDEVEPAAVIVRRFATGAMSFGSISKEAHENLAIAMNRMGARSNSGEGGEDPERFVEDARGDSRRSRIKQVASGRFGVTAHYLVNADELQIKIAQGAKPGEGGQLPGHKVDAIIARVRHSTPGVTLISPPPHHDIYSIEDLAQLIFDLKNVNPRARISVKLVAEAGVGTIAAGVAKAHADCIHIAGHDGGTGASPLSSIQHAGGPWEIGLAETQQILVLNGLRSRVCLQVDGQLKTGRDVAFAALLGAEEFGVATAALVASGCVMMRKCHLNTCPVGIATQDPVLRERFRGQPEHVIRLFFYMAEELRQIMARLGFRRVADMVGRVNRIAVRTDVDHPKATLLNFGAVLHSPHTTDRSNLTCTETQDHGLAAVADHELIRQVEPSLERGEAMRVSRTISNADRAFGAMLAGEIARRYGAEGLPESTIEVALQGTAGQSFGAFATRGMTLTLEGAANDYVGKGLSGGILAVRPPQRAAFTAGQHVIVGNTVLYGATAGKAFFAGRAGERFAVRNSGCMAVVEGVGDHGCEYMTGGVVVVLGPTGRNFGAGMSGGVALVADDDGGFAKRCNHGMIALETLSADDVGILRGLIEEHVERTGSPKGSTMLANWETWRPKFVKVMPLDYKRVIQSQQATAMKVVQHG